MNATLENLAACKKLLRIEIEPQVVDEAFSKTTRSFQHQARLPGFRPGKAPSALIAKNFAKEIESEVKRELISENYKKAVSEHKLRVIGYPDIEEIQFGRGQALQFAATIETAPEFEVPNYKNIPVKAESRGVMDEDMERALTALRERRANYKDLTRPVEKGDFVVVNYIGTSEGSPITEIAPTAKGLAHQQGFWMHVEHDQFIPGFTDQLIGANAGEKRIVNVDFPADFVTPQLQGKKGTYDVEIVKVMERTLPELDDQMAKDYGAESLEKLREGVRRDLENELKLKVNRSIRNQLVGALLRQTNFDVPESLVASETRNVIYDVVRENHQRGLTKEDIDSKKDEIYSFASQNAKERIKIAFLLGRVAEAENIKVNQEEITNRILYLANQYQMKPEKFVKQLQERNGISEIHEQILSAKVLDFLQLNAKVEESASSAPSENPGSNPS